MKTKESDRPAGWRLSGKQRSKKYAALISLASVLIFLALAAIGYTVSGFCCNALAAGRRHSDLHCRCSHPAFQKNEAGCSPFCWRHCLLVVLFARNPLLNGFGAAWNTLRGLWAAEKGILLPLAETDGTGLWLAGIVTWHSACDGECRALARTDTDGGFTGSLERSGSIRAAGHPAPCCGSDCSC